MIGPPPVEIFTSAAHLTIANLHLEISCSDMPVVQEKSGIYHQFTSPGHSHEIVSIPVNIQLQKILPLLALMTKTFETEKAWAMYTDSDSTFIAQHHLDRSREPRWLVKIPPDLKEFTVYCSRDSVRQHNGQDAVMNPVRYPLDQLLLIHTLVGKGLLIHGAGVIIDNRGYIFAGQSGAGKSTLCSLLNEHAAFRVLSDDRVVILHDDGRYKVFGTPWPGEAGIAINDWADLHGIFFLRQAAVNSLTTINPGKTLEYLFKVSSLPWYNKSGLKNALDFCNELLGNISTLEMNFRPEKGIIKDILSFTSS